MSESIIESVNKTNRSKNEIYVMCIQNPMLDLLELEDQREFNCCLACWINLHTISS